MNDCFDITNLPNYDNECWLNTLLVSILYSQYSRDLLLNVSSNWKSDIYLNIIKNIIYSYYANEKNANIYYKTIIPARLLSEIILNSSGKRKSKWSEYHIIDFYNFLGVSCYDLIYVHDGNKDRFIGNYLSNKTESPIQPPEVLVLFHQDLHSIGKKILKSKENISKYVLNTRHIDVGTVITYDNEIEFMGSTYVLTSCLSNNNDSNKYHLVSGIVCNNKKMVFNSYSSTKTNQCSLIPYEWDLKKNEEFCFNPNECKINLTTNIKKLKDLCFSFGTGNRTLIYVRKNKIDTANIQLKKIELQEFTPEPVLTNFQEEINKIKNMSLIALLNELEQINGHPVDVKSIKSITNESYRDDLELVILDSKLNPKLPKEETNKSEPKTEDTTIPTEEIKAGMKKTKKELIAQITKHLSKLNKKNLLSIYSKVLNH